MLTQTYTEALERALGGVVAQARGELSLIRERADALVAGANARVAEADARILRIDQQIEVRLASVRDGEPGKSVTVDDVAPLILVEVGKAVASLPLPKDGRDADAALVEPIIVELVEARIADAVKRLPPPVPGKDADPEVIGMMVADAVSRISQPKDGVDGVPGKDGIDGAPGRDGVDGAPGVQGDRGLDGEPGKDGLNGADGKDGVTGRDGVDGAPGAQGERGIPGETGERGADGPLGPSGSPGERGEAGDAGPIGPMGERGLDGLPGAKGETGERGLEGPIGKLPVIRAWTESVHYEGVAVSHAGSTYQALRDTGREPPHEDWIVLARSGSDGKNGQSFTIRGTWSESEAYRALDVVALGGASFAARRDEPGACPSDGWQLVAAQGKRGNAGERGGPGKQGERGEPGSPAMAAEIDGDGLFTITNGDGSVIKCDFYPVLTKARGE